MLQGAVINVSSVGALVPMSPNMASYGVAKAAQDQLTKNLAFEFATKGVRVNSVLPGKSRQPCMQFSWPLSHQQRVPAHPAGFQIPQELGHSLQDSHLLGQLDACR